MFIFKKANKKLSVNADPSNDAVSSSDTKKPRSSIIGDKYLDRNRDLQHRSSVWKFVSLILLVVTMILCFTVVYLSIEVINRIENKEYILAPGIQTFTQVRPGELSTDFIASAYTYIIEKYHSWTYTNASSNYDELYRYFFTTNLSNKIRSDMKSQNFFEEISTRKINSFWTYLPEKSHFHWCPTARVYGRTSGVACGIVTGIQKMYTADFIPLNEVERSYLIYGINTIPDQRNFFAIRVMRLRAGPYNILKKELQNTLKTGVLPTE